MEDLDAARVRPGAATGQLEDLHAVRLDWDGLGLHQAQRLDLYRDAIGRLEAAGLVYPCYCSRAEIRAAVSAPHGSAPAYPGTCRELSRAQRTERARGGRPPALRFRADGATVAFDDALLGRWAEIVDDFVVRCGTERPPTTSRSWSTTRPRGSAKSSAAPTSSRLHRPRRRRDRCARPIRRGHELLLLGGEGAP